VGLAVADFRRDPLSSDSLRKVIFPKKNKTKLYTKFPGFATSDRHNSAMITNTKNSTAKWSPMGCPVSIFIVRINSKPSPGLYAVHQKGTYTNLIKLITDTCVNINEHV